MIKSTLVTSSSVTVPTLVYTSSRLGSPVSSPSNLGQTNAVTTIALCNIAAVTLTDETANAVTVNIYFARQGVGAQPTGADCNIVVSNLVVPAGETVFFSEERFVLDAGDEIYVGTSVANRLAVTVSTLPV